MIVIDNVIYLESGNYSFSTSGFFALEPRFLPLEAVRKPERAPNRIYLRISVFNLISSRKVHLLHLHAFRRSVK